MTRYANVLSIALVAVSCAITAQADQSGTFTLSPHVFLNLETGATSNTGGDIRWDGAALTPQGRAGLFNLGKYGTRGYKFIAARVASGAAYSAEPIPASVLVAGDVFGVRTNSGHFAKVLVTAAEGGALSIQYTTFLSARSSSASLSTKDRAAASGPVISKLQNNYSYIVPGLPNYGIAPGSLFVIFGTGLSTSAPPVLQSSAAPGLPATLNQTSVSVTVGGVTTTPGLYYTTATSIAAVLPSTTPVGTGTVTVTYNGQTSAAAPIKVVASAVGLDTLYGSGFGAGVVTDTNFNVLGLKNSAMPGQAVILWGSGIGADTANDDKVYPQGSHNLTAAQTQIFIGGISANVLYSGRSQYPGLDQFDVVVPPNVSPGCFVSVVLQTGSVVSNTITMPVDPSGAVCSDPATGLTGTQLQSFAAKTTVNSLGMVVAQTTNGANHSQTQAFALAGAFGGANFGTGMEYASQGSCIVIPPSLGNFSPNALDAGASIQLSGAAGNASLSNGGGFYGAQLSNPLTPGTYTLTGSGGKDLGSFKVALTVGTPLTVTNNAALATITRSQGATVNWTGGFPNGDVQISISAGAPAVKFFCHAPSGAGQFTIPPSILLALPAGAGSFSVGNYSAPQTVTASGLDVGAATALVSTVVKTTLK